MTPSTDPKTRRTIPLLIGSRRVGCAHHQSASRFREIVAVVLFLTIVSTAYAKYSGGSGTALDPYEIATAADLIALGATPADYDKQFILTADIDMDPKLPGRKVFDKAVIAPETDPMEGFQGTSFAGVFDGNRHTVSHLTIKGKDDLGLFGRLSGEVRNLGIVDVTITGSGGSAGALVGCSTGSVIHCYASGTICGGSEVGGLVGLSSMPIAGRFLGYITESYSTAHVKGESSVGGLVGSSGGSITACYSTGPLSGARGVGGLIGENSGEVTACFWDIQTSGQVSSAGGTGKTTA